MCRNDLDDYSAIDVKVFKKNTENKLKIACVIDLLMVLFGVFKMMNRSKKEVIPLKRFEGQHLASLISSKGMDAGSVSRGIIRIMPDATISAPTIKNWIRTGNMTAKYMGPLAKVLGCTIDDLFIDMVQ